MGINWADCITFQTKEGGRVSIPRAAILSVKTKLEKDYSGGAPYPDREITHLYIQIDVAELLGVDIDRTHRKDIGIFYPVGNKFELVMGMLRGDKAVEVLFDTN